MNRFCRKICLALALMLLLMSVPVPVMADMGPKPSVQLKIKSFDNETQYAVTMLSYSSYGSGSVSSITKENCTWYDQIDDEIMKAYIDYKDVDGFYYFGNHSVKTGDSEYNWNYWPPNKFKVLIYFPEEKIFAVSEICEQYALDNYFNVEIKFDDVEGTYSVRVNADYHLVRPIIMFLLRVAATFVVEMFIAALFLYSEKYHIKVIVITNIITQILLNLYLSYVAYTEGVGWEFTLVYLILEFWIFIIEGVIYKISFAVCEKRSDYKTKFVFLYAFIANLVSFLAGVFMV